MPRHIYQADYLHTASTHTHYRQDNAVFLKIEQQNFSLLTINWLE